MSNADVGAGSAGHLIERKPLFLPGYIHSMIPLQTLTAKQVSLAIMAEIYTPYLLDNETWLTPFAASSLCELTPCLCTCEGGNEGSSPVPGHLNIRAYAFSNDGRQCAG